MLTRTSVMYRPCLSRRRMDQSLCRVLQGRGKEGRARFLSKSREAQAFPPWTLVLADHARSRHDRPVCLRAEGGRNLRRHYRRASKLKSNFDNSRKRGWILRSNPLFLKYVSLVGEPDECHPCRARACPEQSRGDGAPLSFEKDGERKKGGPPVLPAPSTRWFVWLAALRPG